MPAYNFPAMARPTKKPATDFGRRLSQARQAAGLTQMELAERLDVSQQMIDYYERRANNPTIAFVRKAAAVLSISADELLGQTAQPVRRYGPVPQLEQRLQALRQLPREKQKLVLQFLDSFLRDTQNSKPEPSRRSGTERPRAKGKRAGNQVGRD